MKKTALLSIFALINLLVYSQDLTTVLEKTSTALGLHARESASGLQYKGYAVMNDTEAKIPFKMTQSRPDKIRIETTIFGFKSIQTYNGSEAWLLSPTKGMEAVPANERDMEFVAAATAIDGPFSYNKDNKYTLKYMGEQTYQDKSAELVMWTSKEEKLKYYINTDNYRITAVKYEYHKNGGWYSMEYRVRSYTKFEGSYFPTEVSAVINGVEMITVYVEDIRKLDKIEPEQFEKPSWE